LIQNNETLFFQLLGREHELHLFKVA
jgi:hypothetical protein